MGTRRRCMGGPRDQQGAGAAGGTQALPASQAGPRFAPPANSRAAQRAVPAVQEEEIVVELEAADDAFARRLGAFVVAAVERLRQALAAALPGACCGCSQGARCRAARLPFVVARTRGEATHPCPRR